MTTPFDLKFSARKRRPKGYRRRAPAYIMSFEHFREVAKNADPEAEEASIERQYRIYKAICTEGAANVDLVAVLHDST